MSLLLLIIVGLFALAIWASRPVAGFAYDAGGLVVRSERASRAESPRRLTIMTWNVAFAHGPGSSAHEMHHREVAKYQERLHRIAAAIAALKPDIALLQEVDFNSARSHHVDQAAWLAADGSWPEARGATSWSVRFLPYPLTLAQRPLGQVASGGLVLSRWPLSVQHVMHHAPPSTQPWWYNAFYLRRYTQRIVVELGGDSWSLFNVHFEDQSEANRRAAAQALRGAVLGAVEPVLVVGGDFNAGMNDPSVAMLKGVRGLKDGAAHANGATSPDGDARIDHLLVGDGWDVVHAEIGDTGDASDHRPLIVTIERSR